MTTPMPARRRKRRRLRTAGGCLLLIAFLFLFTTGIEFAWKRIDQYRFPWGYPELGGPALVGTWAGTLTTGGGIMRGIYMDLRLRPFETRRRGRSFVIRTRRKSNFVGEVRLCGGEREQRFTITGGNMLDNAASRIFLSLYPADSNPPDGLAPSHIRGGWNGKDSLALEADVHMRRGKSAISNSADPNTGKPATIGMKHGNEAEFAAICARGLGER